MPQISEVLLGPCLLKKKAGAGFKYKVIEIHPHQSYVRAVELLTVVMTMLLHGMYRKRLDSIFIPLSRAVAKPGQAIIFSGLLTKNDLLYG